MALTDDAVLIDRTKSALENFSDCPWLPDLTSDLAEVGRRVLYQKTGLALSNYGTSRVIARSVHAPRNVVAYLSTSWAIEVLDESFARYYKDAGIVFYTVDEISCTNLLKCVEDAIHLIKRVPTLHATVDTLVKSLHLIKPADDDYDVSFSEPQIPFSIFVSVPQQQISTTALQIAEAVVHEAMHLQLTLIEQNVPLTISTSEQYYSPWRKEYRDAQGILHALYVFRVIDRFLEQLALIGRSTDDVMEYIHDRRYDIGKQISEIQSFHQCPALTRVGACFVQRLIEICW